jgi:hypothetical protein
MSFLSGIGNFFNKVTSVVDTVTKVLSTPLDSLMKPVDSLVNSLVEKLPFGNVLSPFVDRFLNMGVSWLAGGPLGGVASMLSTAATTAQKVDSVLHTVDGVLNGGVAGLQQPALENAQNLFSFSQAQTLLS